MTDAGASPEIPPPPAIRPGPDEELLGLIDSLAELLYRSDLTELEIESGGTGLVLRKSVAGAATEAPPAPAHPADVAVHADSSGGSSEPAAPSVPSVKAPLTGIFYASPAPGSAPYVQVGGEVAVGQVIGLIEAMKLFNEIKSDVAGKVVRILVERGTLVKRQQPLVEIDPR